jgi:hypothetical protein
LANQPRKIANKNISSNLTTTSLPGTPPISNSGERSIEKINIVKAISVLTKAITNAMDAKRKTAANSGSNLKVNMNIRMTIKSIEIMIERFV